MAKAKKTANKRAAGKVKVNKTAWVQSLPSTMPAKEVVAKAKAEGFTISPAQVYTARSKAKSKGASPAVARVVQSSGGSTAGHARDFRRLVLRMGIDQADAELAKLKQSVGLG